MSNINRIKTRLFLLLWLIIAQGSIAGAQTAASGMYLTEKDFLNRKLNYPLPENARINLHEFWGGTHVTFNYQGSKKTLSKSETFGCRIKNTDYRFFHNSPYQIIDTAGFLLYTRYLLIPKSKGAMLSRQYYFSTDYLAEIWPLTKATLEKAFMQKTAFRYAVQSFFPNDQELSEYDSAENQYKLKYIYFHAQLHSSKPFK